MDLLPLRPGPPISFVALLAALLAASACGGAGAPGDPPGGGAALLPAQPIGPAHLIGQTEVVFLGTLHERHRESAVYPPELIAAIIRAVDPDVVLVELPPAGFDMAIGEARALVPNAQPEVVFDPFLRRAPEIYQVVVPLAGEMGYSVVPVSGWTRETRDRRTVYSQESSSGPVERQYMLARATLYTRLYEANAFEDIAFLHGEEYLSLLNDERRWFSWYTEGELGDAGELHVNARTADLVDEAIDANPGARILLVYDVTSRWYLEPALDAREDIVRIPVVEFLP